MSKDHHVYGKRADEVHPFFKKKREWSKVKDTILGAYVTCYLRTVHRRGRPGPLWRRVGGFSLDHLWGD